ncbi:hypothetical protein CW700_06310 [Candidatus Bathyarchaeota archaeon]|nr:MAG: hypothetical protein CW700_06310 [Candidatus Bathyarchaeota archaeon]
MRLFAKISDPDLFLKMIYEAGTAFYSTIKGNEVEAIYFSSNRTIYFKDEMTPAQYQNLKAQAYPVETISIDNTCNQVEISQLMEE